jgi:acetyl esterase/lipase
MIRTLTYASPNGSDLMATLFSPASQVPAPTIVCVHGGGWRLGDRNFYRYLGPYLAGLGYAVLAIDYRLASDGRNQHPAALDDVRAALDYVRAEGPGLGLDASRIVVMGDSAGGHLACLAALTDPIGLSAFVGIYGVYDLAAQWTYDVGARPSDNITETLLGVSLLDDPRPYFEASPISHVTRRPQAPGVFLAWGIHDDVVDPHQSERFRDALKAASFRVRTMTVPAGHYWITEPLDEPTSNAHLFATRLRWFLEETVPASA